ncbi:hypothetical protein pdam_00006400, partial [Pocillopora damicornis]
MERQLKGKNISRTELLICPESHGNHKIKMASICCECGSLVTSLTKTSPKWMILESRQRNEEKACGTCIKGVTLPFPMGDFLILDHELRSLPV